MKNLFRTLLCTALLALLLCGGVSAAQEDSGVSILLNGQELTFTDARPQIVNDRTYLPFRAVFTALGFEDDKITYQEDTKTVRADSGGLTISMVIGENKVTVTQAGQTRVLETDAPAFIDASLGRTYVPARFVSEAAGYRVGWNGETRTVIIDDVDAILSANQASYTVLEQYLEYCRQFQTGNQQVAGSYSADMTVSGQAMKMGGDYSMALAGSSTLDFSTRMNLSGTVDGQDLAAAIPGGVDFEMRGSLDTGLFYFKSNTLMTTLESGAKDVWFKLDLSQMTGSALTQAGISYPGLFTLSQQSAAALDGRAYIEALVRSMAQADASLSVQAQLDALNAMFSDSAFTKENSAYVSVYQQAGVTMSMTLTTSGGKVDGYTVTISGGQAAGAAGTARTDMSVSMKGSQLTARISMDMGASMSMKMEMDGVYSAGSAAPLGTPGKDAAVLDMADMLKTAA